MITKETQSKLCKFLVKVGSEEKNLEVVRQILCEQPEFEPYVAFKRIDRKSQGFLTSLNIQQFLINNGITADERECALFIDHYDINDDGKLEYSEFVNSVIPQDNYGLRCVVTQRPTYEVKQNQLLTYDVEYALARVFDREIKSFIILDGYKKALQCCRDFQIRDAFFTIDKYNSGYIDYENLMDFLSRFGYTFIEDQIACIIRYIDKGRDGKIDLVEFDNALQVRFEDRTQSKLSQFMENDDPVQYFKDNLGPNNNFQSVNNSKLNQGNSFQNQSKSQSQSQYGSPNKVQLSRMQNSIYNKGQIDPTQYIPPNNKTAQSILKHIENQSIGAEKRTHKSTTQSILKQQKLVQQVTGNGKKLILTNRPQTNSLVQRPFSKIDNRKNRSEDNWQREEATELARTLRQFIALDKEVEALKEDLVMRNDFNLIDAFRLFDIDGKGKWTASEFELALNAFGLYPSKYSMYLVLKRYDRDNDGRININEFKDLILPKKKEYENLAVDQRLEENDGDLFAINGEIFSNETRQIFVQFLQVIIENESACESLRQRLNKRKLFNVKLLFRWLDTDKDGFIKISEFQQIFDDAGIILNEHDFIFLFNRFDKNVDGRISYSEFILEMIPKSPQRF